MTRQEAFNADMERYQKALEPWVLGDVGEEYLSPEAPQELAQSYWRLAQYGYANGWLQWLS